MKKCELRYLCLFFGLMWFVEVHLVDRLSIIFVACWIVVQYSLNGLDVMGLVNTVERPAESALMVDSGVMHWLSLKGVPDWSVSNALDCFHFCCCVVLMWLDGLSPLERNGRMWFGCPFPRLWPCLFMCLLTNMPVTPCPRSAAKLWRDIRWCFVCTHCATVLPLAIIGCSHDDDSWWWLSG